MRCPFLNTKQFFFFSGFDSFPHGSSAYSPRHVLIPGNLQSTSFLFSGNMVADGIILECQNIVRRSALVHVGFLETAGIRPSARRGRGKETPEKPLADVMGTVLRNGQHSSASWLPLPPFSLAFSPSLSPLFLFLALSAALNL